MCNTYLHTRPRFLLEYNMQLQDLGSCSTHVTHCILTWDIARPSSVCFVTKQSKAYSLQKQQVRALPAGTRRLAKVSVHTSFASGSSPSFSALCTCTPLRRSCSCLGSIPILTSALGLLTSLPHKEIVLGSAPTDKEVYPISAGNKWLDEPLVIGANSSCCEVCVGRRTTGVQGTVGEICDVYQSL